MDAITAYFQMIEKTMSKHTVRSYKKDVTKFANEFSLWEDVSKVSDITREEFRDFIFGMGLSETSTNSAIRNIGAFVNWLKSDGYVDDEIITTTKFGNRHRYVKEPKKEIVVLSDKECRSLIEAGQDLQTRFMITLMLTVGARRDEVSKIKLSDIDFETGKIVLDGKGKKERTVGMVPSVQQMLEIYLAMRDTDSEYLFYSTRASGENGRLSTVSINNRIKTAATNANFPKERVEDITAHALRKTCATRLAKQFPLPVVQKILGHANIQTTMLYIGVTDASDMMMEQELGF